MFRHLGWFREMVGSQGLDAAQRLRQLLSAEGEGVRLRWSTRVRAESTHPTCTELEEEAMTRPITATLRPHLEGSTLCAHFYILEPKAKQPTSS